MQTFQDFISRRFQYNEDSGMQTIIVATPNIENINNMLYKIIQHIFRKGDPKSIKEIMDCLSKNNDNTIKGEVRELAKLIGLAGNKDLYDVPLGGLGSNNKDPAEYPNQDQDGSSHF
jgi:hypothetical protein